MSNSYRLFTYLVQFPLFSVFKASNVTFLWLLSLTLLSLTIVRKKYSIFNDLCEKNELTKIIQDNHSNSRSLTLITSAKSPWPCKETFTHSGIRVRTYPGSHYPACHQHKIQNVYAEFHAGMNKYSTVEINRGEWSYLSYERMSNNLCRYFPLYQVEPCSELYLMTHFWRMKYT